MSRPERKYMLAMLAPLCYNDYIESNDSTKASKVMEQPLTDAQIAIGMQVVIREPGRQPLNGAIGTVVAIGEYDHAPIYTLALYGAKYGPFRAYDLYPIEAK